MLSDRKIGPVSLFIVAIMIIWTVLEEKEGFALKTATYAKMSGIYHALCV